MDQTTKARIDLFLFQLETTPDCERCHGRIGAVMWGEKVICRECWSELLDEHADPDAGLGADHA